VSRTNLDGFHLWVSIQKNTVSKAERIFPLLTERSGDILSSVTDRRGHEQTI
jgi:hypothetical protein